MRWNSVAPSAEKKTKRSTPRALGRPQQPHRRQAVQLLDRGRGGWSRIVAARWITVSTPRSACAQAGAELGEVAERDLHVDPLRPEPPRLAHQART